LNSKLNWIWFELIQRKTENLTIHLGIAAAYSYRGTLGQAQLARSTARPLAAPCHWGTAQRVHDVERHGVVTASAPIVASSPPTEHRLNLEDFLGETVTKRWPTCGYTRTQKGRLGRYSSPLRRSAQRRETTSTGKSAWKWKKVLLDRLRSYTRAPWTLGTTWLAMRSKGVGARAAKTRAKAP
jgi:hypothetical protein